MKNTFKILIAIVAFIFGLTSFSFASLPTKEKRPGHILYKMKDGAPQFKKDRVTRILNGHRAWTRKHLRGNPDVKLMALEYQRDRTEEDICAEIMASGGAEFAEPDYLVPPEQIPNDPKYTSQWHHAKINTPVAWDITTGNQQVIVAVCDTGVQADHPDLAANLLLPGYNTVDGTTNTDPVMSHGTQTTGCVAAIGNNALGVAGMAWNIKLLPIRVSNSSDGSAYYSDLAEAITYAADHGAKVASLSYGVGGSSTIDTAAQYARSKGMLVFVAAGNSNASVTYPDFTSFILVGATDQNDAKASFSNYGAALDIVAPGVSIGTTNTGSGYASVSGTSYCTPITAGLAALIYSINPNFTPAEVENFIFSTAVDLGTPGRDTTFGRGRINAAAAVQAAKINFSGDPPPVALFEASAYTGVTPLSDTFDASASYTPNGIIETYAWDFGDGTTGSGKTTSHTYSTAGNINVTLTVTDNLGATNSITKAITVSTASTNLLPNAWTISAVSGVNAAVADGILTVQFAVAQDINYYHATQKANVTGNTSYKLSGYIKTDALVDNRGVCLELVDSRGYTYLDKSTTKFSGTKDWTYVEIAFTTPADTTQVVVRARRISGLGTVQGTSYFKEVTLVKTSTSSNTPPVALFDASAYTGTTPFTPTLDASASYDPDGTINAYAWDFGDGTTGSGKTTSHTYSTAGNINVTLTVTDNLGATNSITKAITVSTASTNLLPNVWTISAVSGVNAAVTDGVLTVEFAVAQDINYYHATQKANVTGNTNYKLSGYIKTDALVDNRGVCLELVDSRGWTYLDKSTTKFSGTKDWTYVEVLFTTPADTQQVVVRARRVSGSGTVQGKSYFKNVTLVKN